MSKVVLCSEICFQSLEVKDHSFIKLLLCLQPSVKGDGTEKKQNISGHLASLLWAMVGMDIR
jgi:hypothetical protein